MLIDAHAHVNFAAYKDDSDEVIKRSLAEDIWMINVGSQLSTSKRAVEFAQKYKKGVYAAVGLHPIHLQKGMVEAHADEFETVEFETKAEEFLPETYKELLRDPKVVAIGEIGLDYYRNPGTERLQKEVLLEQLVLAGETKKPIIFHCREAHNDMLKALGEWDFMGNPKLQGVIHSFSGCWSQAEQYLKMGFYLGFNGIITFARDYDRVVKEMPLDRLILETDCPYLTPIPFRGKRNEPSYVKYVAQKVAEIRGIAPEEISQITTENTKKLFNI